MSKDLRRVIEELKQRRDNLDAVIKILEDEVCPEETKPERKRRGRHRKSEAAGPSDIRRLPSGRI